jgi:hypothetical protein
MAKKNCTNIKSKSPNSTLKNNTNKMLNIKSRSHSPLLKEQKAVNKIEKIIKNERENK